MPSAPEETGALFRPSYRSEEGADGVEPSSPVWKTGALPTLSYTPTCRRDVPSGRPPSTLPNPVNPPRVPRRPPPRYSPALGEGSPREELRDQDSNLG